MNFFFCKACVNYWQSREVNSQAWALVMKCVCGHQSTYIKKQVKGLFGGLNCKHTNEKCVMYTAANYSQPVNIFQLARRVISDVGWNLNIVLSLIKASTFYWSLTAFYYQSQRCPTLQWSWRKSGRGNTGLLVWPRGQRGSCTLPWPEHRGHCLLVPPLEAPWRKTQSGTVRDSPKLGHATLLLNLSLLLFFIFYNQPNFHVAAKLCWCDTFCHIVPFPRLISTAKLGDCFKIRGVKTKIWTLNSTKLSNGSLTLFIFLII